MHDAQTPQQALDIAAATTRQAHEAAALPSWGPFAAGAFAGLFVTLFGLAKVFGFDNPVAWAATAGAIASYGVYFAISRWLRRVRFARGLIPAPLAEWKFMVVLLLVLLIPDFGLENLTVAALLQLLGGLIMGGWIWFAEARPKTALWKIRPWRI
ncbi:hypothetical protein ABZ942_28205 [Nocardia sp. NPDC046473]|uniref:hypothetical protein n=1 Tax=Nocardia sp. NPDC046473 TaxID=3155733 RepID=UPI0033ECF1C5